MAFKDIFKDENDFNEKTIIGFMSFAVMTLYSITDLVPGYAGMELPINDFVYNDGRGSQTNSRGKNQLTLNLKTKLKQL